MTGLGMDLAAPQPEDGQPAVPPGTIDLTGRYPVMSEEWVAIFVHHVRAAVLNEWDHAPRTSCVPTMRIALTAAAYFGVHCAPWAVRAEVIDLASNTHSITGGTGQVDPATGQWDAHMIGHLGHTYLIDPSADQLGHPDHGLHTAPWAFPVPPDAFRPGHYFGVDDSTRPGRTVKYKILPVQGTWRLMHWWIGEPGRARRAHACAIINIRKATRR